MLIEKTQVGFDLDDTLHEFGRRSEMATNKVLEETPERYGTLCMHRTLPPHLDQLCYLLLT